LRFIGAIGVDQIHDDWTPLRHDKEEGRSPTSYQPGPLPPRVLFAFSLLMVAWGNTCQAAATSKASLPPEIVKFIQDKEAHARALAKKLDLEVSPDVWAFFRTAQTGTIPAITNAFERLKKRASQYEGSRMIQP
jgi:hypothetical protein